MSQSTKTIAILGTPVSSGNRGVLALGSSLAGLFIRQSPDMRVVILASNSKPTTLRVRLGPSEQREVPVVNYRMSPRSKPSQHLLAILLAALTYRLLPFASLRAAICERFPFIESVARANLVGDIRGGDSFSDIYGFKRFALAFLPSLAVLLIRGSMAHFPQTYGPFRGKLARAMGSFLLKRSSHVIARDTKSRQAALDLLSGRKDVALTPDVAFSLTPIAPAEAKLEPAFEGGAALESRKAIGLNVNGLMYNGGYSRANMFGLKMDYSEFLLLLATELLGKTNKDLILVPHTFAPAGDVESDNAACKSLRAQLSPQEQERVRIVAEDYDQYEIKGLIGLCDFFIGSRMHSCIAALSQGVPCVGVAYSMKFQGVFESVGMGDWVVDARAVTKESACESIHALYAKKEDCRVELEKSAGAAKEKLYCVFGQMTLER